MSDTNAPTPGPSDSSDSGSSPKSRSKSTKTKKGKPNVFSRVSLFIREIIAELRKVIWPTRKELITYTWVVIVFVVIMASIVAVLDFVFTKGVLAVFGD